METISNKSFDNVPDSNSQAWSLSENSQVELFHPKSKGTSPPAQQQPDILLRKRLSGASLMLMLIVFVHLIQGVLQDYFHLVSQHWPAVIVLLFMVILNLRIRGPNALSQNELRMIEVVLFGSSSLAILSRQFIHLYQLQIAQSSDQILSAYIGYQNCNVYWYALLSVYAIFIPNTLLRAAAVIMPMISAPVLLTLLMRWACNQVEKIIELETFSNTTLMLLVGALVGIYGTHIIHNLRMEAQSAKQWRQYRLISKIGSGGMGEVYLAEHRLLRRPCAVKLIRPHPQLDSKTLARFQREVQTTACLSHKNTVKVYDYGLTPEGVFYYVMEYLPGLSLADLVRLHGPLPASRAVYLLRQACQALAEAHAVGFLHRDIKPGNIIACCRKRSHDLAKIVDFGLVKPLVEEANVRLTQEGTFAGTPLYMAPEQAQTDQHPDVRSDIYSLGAVAYYLVCGRPPFQAKSPMKVVMAHLREAVVPPSLHQPELPTDVESIILRCLAKLPQDRFPSVLHLDAALSSCSIATDWNEKLACKWWQEINNK